MAAGAWENSSAMAGSDDASSAPQSVWNMTGLVNGLPSVASAPGGLAGSELTGLKQNRMVDSALPDMSAGGWGPVSTSVGKDSAWNRPDSGVSLDIGTKAWESQQSSVTSAVWGQPQSDKPSSQWCDIDIRQKNGLIIRDTGESPWDVRPKSWGDIPVPADLTSSQNGSISVPSSSAASSQPPVDLPSSASTAESSTTTSVSETSPTDNLSASSMPQALSRDEIIANAINTNEAWGRTPIRQDVPWVIDEEPTVREPIQPLPKLPSVDPADAQISRIGTGAWEQLRGGAAAGAVGWMSAGRSREDSGSWSISSPDGLSIAGAAAPGVGREFAGGVVGMSAFRPPTERPSSSTGGLLSAFPADRPPTGWGGGNLESAENLWKDKDTRGNFAGAAQQPLRRNLSTGNWPSDEPGGWNSAGGASAEVEDLLNQGRQQNWRSVSRPPTAQSVGQAGLRARPDERGDASMFGVPPPSLQPGFRPGSRAGSQEDVVAAGQWGSLSVKLPNAAAATGGWGDPAAQWPPAGIDTTRLKAPPTAAWNDDWNSRKQQPQTRNRILQQLMDVGFRKEEAQAALINNNMDLRSAIAELVASHNSLDPAARGSSTAPVDVRFPPGAAAAARQQQLLVDQLQQQQQQQRLISSLGGILASGLPVNTNQLQKLMQQQQPGAAPDSHGRVPVSPESVQAALQQQQMALLQSAHAAVQANLIPPHLIAAVPSLNPTVASKLQRLVQLVDVHQKLGSQGQLPVPGYPASADFNAVIKQQIVQLRQEVVLALTSSIPPPPLANQPPAALPTDVLHSGNVQSPEDMAASSRLSQWKQPVDASSKMAATAGPANGPLPLPAAWPTMMPSGSSAASDKNSSGNDESEGGVTSSSLEIEEFVPGKPWQGPSVRNVEDDPYITPGSVTRSAISAIDDTHVMNILGAKPVPPGTRARQASSVWSNEPTSQAPGPQLGRSISWAPGDRTNASMNVAVSAPTSSLRIRNLPAQIDYALLKALVERFGSLRLFVASPSGDHVLVSYVHAEEAMQAHRSLTAGLPGGMPPLVIDFVSDADLMRSLDSAIYSGSSQPAESGWPSGLGTAFGGSSGGSVWSSGGTVEEHSSFLPSDLFSGGQ